MVTYQYFLTYTECCFLLLKKVPFGGREYKYFGGIQIFRNICIGGENKYFEIFVLGNTNISKYLYWVIQLWGNTNISSHRRMVL